MVKLNLGDTYNDLTDEQLEILGNLTEGYSGSDIYNLTQDAIYGPLRKCQKATHFKNLDQNHIVPCSPSDHGAFRMKINDIPNPESLVAPVVTFEDFILSLQKMKPTVSKKDLERQEQFTILGNLTKGYSGSDIYNLTQDAIYGPLRKCQRATHFKHLDPNHIVPCSPSDPGAKEMKINDIDHPEMLVAPVVTFEDFILSLQKMKPTVSEEDLKRQQQFTQEFGTEG